MPAKLDGFHRRAKDLASKQKIRIEHVRTSLTELPALVVQTSADAVLYVPSWKHSVDEFNATMASLPPRGSRPGFAIFDTFDQTSSPFFGALPLIDCYVKSQLLSDRSAYLGPTAETNNIAGWVRDHLGFDLGSWRFGSMAPAGYETRLVCGWNMGMSRVYRVLTAAARLIAPSWRRRTIELNRRFSIPQPTDGGTWEWYQAYRRFCGLRINDLAARFNLSGSGRISSRQFAGELRQSRIVFSPFGWGEVCFRDFEAIAAGAVLIKPDMSHLTTNPNIYEEGVTYRAVRWDLADLGDVCQEILDHPEESEQIIEQGRKRMIEYCTCGHFDNSVADLMGRLRGSGS